jgi:UDP-N-acetylglucosamine--N-acetylmuramyl-(pentapeptide) pyrophosphoryl-undecaprenol N-acetylglucosamine transferase
MRIAFYLNLQGMGHCRRFEAIAPYFPLDCELAVVGMNGPPPVVCDRPVEKVSVPGFAPPSTRAFMQKQTLHDYHNLLVNYSGNAAFTLAMVSFLSRWQPDLLVVDVGLEAAILGRMCGIPTIYSRQHGNRWDRGHALAYEWAYSLWAPFAEEMEQTNCPAWISKKTFYSGGFCRFIGKEKAAEPPPGYTKKPNILVMTGFGGTDITLEKIVTAAAAMPDWQWHVLGEFSLSITENLRCYGMLEDVWPYLCYANLVIANAGHNSTMEIMAAGVPSICIPAQRPFAEQQCKAERLSALGLSVVSPGWPNPNDWPRLWEVAKGQDRSGWGRSQSVSAPQQAANYLTNVAKCCSKPVNRVLNA